MDPLDRKHGRYIFTNHTSIEYWESACPAEEGKEHWRTTFERTGAKRIDSFELRAEDKHKWYIRSNRGNLVKVAVSIVTYKTSTANRFSAFYEPKLPNKNQVRNMWESLKKLAESYPYAELTTNNNFNGQFKNWPNSYYQLFGNNCHTFSRWIIDKSGKPVPDAWGAMPGNDLPKNVMLSYNRNGKPPFPK